MIKEFKEFISKGNALDLAVGIIIGVAFGAIVSSVVADLLMPIIGIIMGGIDFSGLSINVGSAVITYGKLVQAVINFLIVAFVLFIIIKVINKFKNTKEEEPAAAVPSKEEELLTEIRDILKSGR